MKLLKLILTTSILLTMFAIMNAQAQDTETETDMLEMSLEDLMNMEVTSVSKKAERLQDVASSIYVLSSDDIEKSGATNLIEALRNVPGFWAMQESYSSAYTSIRNTTPVTTDPGTILYLLDGTPLQELMGQTFSALNFDIPLDEIDRIEVIRGSGGTIYGANSATGVVNIFTKSPDTYDGINVRAEGAAPGYASATVRAGGALNDQLSISGYAKYRFFSGWESLSGKYEDGSDNTELTGNSEFTEDYDKVAHYSAGLKLDYNFSENSKLSIRTHYNGMNKTTYSDFYDENFLTSLDNRVVENDVNANRFVGNLRFDQSFSDNHSLFFRVSTNYENDFYRLGGGMKISNSIYDVEIQDNISLGSFNDLSIGANYRYVNFDIHDINSDSTINYIDSKSTESISGAFIQDKIKLFDNKLNFTLGIKAENYSLVNDKYYLSPMAKVSYIANEKITFWGGFTQSYTTPGFNNTNIDLFLFQTPGNDWWTAVIGPEVTQAVYEGAYQQAIDGGADPTIANALATEYVASTEGQAMIAGGIEQNSAPNIGAKNGSNTVPTQFQTWEVGFKSNFADKFQINSTFFKTFITDGVAVNPGDVLPGQVDQESVTQPGRFVDYYLYGNYVKGESIGSETMIRFMPISGLLLELSHSWMNTDWKYQENSDFDVSTINSSPNSVPNYVPEHIIRFRVNYEFENGLNINAQLIQTSEHRKEDTYVFATERYKNVVESDLGSIIGDRVTYTKIANNDARTIINLRVEKAFLDDKLSVYVFGNDITNSGGLQRTDPLRNTTLSQIGAMYGAGLNYKLK
ncbi:MAG: TonB-dependent receptor plug domain-containing protein [Reichenbachiella sp.]